MTRRIATFAVMSAAVTHAALAQKPPVRTLVPTTTYTSTPGQAKFEASVLSRLHVPPGYHISVFAQGLGAPRIIAVGDDGTVYVTRRDSNDVIALRGDGTGAPRQVVKNLPNVHGITLHDGRMYLATVKEIYVSDMRTDGTVSDPRQIVTDLPDGGQHPNRTLGFGPDGMLYVSIGSTCNLCIETNEENATILRMMADGTERGIFARGLRNTIGWGWHPDTKELWGMDHGSDSKGNDIPPEELNRIQSSTNYGWPFCYGDKVPDKYFSNEPKGSSKDEMCPRTAAPVLSFVAHSAPIQMAFYTGTQFPSDVRGDAFVAMRGSWNRQPPSGYKLVRIHFENGKPVRFDDFATGFITPDGNTYVARLAGVAMAMDGSLLLGDDTNGVIYRISYGGSASAQVPAARAVDTMRVAAPRDTMPLPPMPQARANRVAFIDSLKEPESVLYDADQDVYFISNIDGPSAAKDGKGFISRVPAGGGVKSLRWIESGRNGAMLNAPKGMSINGDTLWVSDLDVMRAFNRKTGAPIASLDLSGQGAAFLNDVVTGADGNVYITDSEVAFDVKGNSMHPRADRVFRVDGRRAVTIALETDRLMRPNGIAWDKAGSRFTIVSWGGDSVFTWKPGTSSVEFLVAGPGQFDGAAFTGDGTLLVSSKATSSIYALRGGKLAPVVQHVSDVADIGIDTRRKLLLVPLTSGNKVEVYQLP